MGKILQVLISLLVIVVIGAICLFLVLLNSAKQKERNDRRRF